MFKNQKGITLIALVITIIVLLILAGITIALITSNDSAPKKAAQAKIEQEVGAAKDTVGINATMQIEAFYESKYVSNGNLGTSSDIAATYTTAILGKDLNTSKVTLVYDDNDETNSSYATSTYPSAVTLTSVETDTDSHHFVVVGYVKTNGTIDWQAGTWK
ncbi:MAG: type II secretion system protein [Clostridia bacterium]|nr:type II secretion system protein [Clostridia bacterium]